MPIVEEKIKSDILSMINNNGGKDSDANQSVDKFASGLSKIIADAIKSATVTVNPGIPVATAGSPTAQTGATTASGTGTLS